VNKQTALRGRMILPTHNLTWLPATIFKSRLWCQNSNVRWPLWI